MNIHLSKQREPTSPWKRMKDDQSSKAYTLEKSISRNSLRKESGEQNNQKSNVIQQTTNLLNNKSLQKQIEILEIKMMQEMKRLGDKQDSIIYKKMESQRKQLRKRLNSMDNNEIKTSSNLSKRQGSVQSVKSKQQIKFERKSSQINSQKKLESKISKNILQDFDQIKSIQNPQFLPINKLKRHSISLIEREKQLQQLKLEREKLLIQNQINLLKRQRLNRNISYFKDVKPIYGTNEDLFKPFYPMSASLGFI